MTYPRITRIYGELLETAPGEFVRCDTPEWVGRAKAARGLDLNIADRLEDVKAEYKALKAQVQALEQD